jgi:Family of unknown function (DUF5681)
VALIPFPRGKSGNPGGRPKGDIELRRAARERTAEALSTLVNIMRNPKAATAARVSAAEAILNRGWGKPVQPSAFVDIEGNDRLLPVEQQSQFETARRIAHLLAQGIRALPAQQPPVQQLDGAIEEESNG